MPLIQYPDVPAAQGVPSLPRRQSSPIVTAALGVAQGALWRALRTADQWGVYDSNGRPLAGSSGILGALKESVGLSAALSTGAVEVAKETRVSDFPIERGSFASYNKVELPANPTVVLRLSGSEAERSAFLAAIDAATKSTDLFSVVTPEVTYFEYAIESYRYSRSQSAGSQLLTVSITLREVRTVTAQYTQSGRQGQIGADTKRPDAAPQVDSGKVQTAPIVEKSTLRKLFGG